MMNNEEVTYLHLGANINIDTEEVLNNKKDQGEIFKSLLDDLYKEIDKEVTNDFSSISKDVQFEADNIERRP